MNKYLRKIARNADGYSDIYDVLKAFPTNSPAIDHAIKKLLMPGQRGGKSRTQDIREAIVSLERALVMEEKPVCPTCNNTGVVDSGGFQPWGDPINLRCPDCGEVPNDENPKRRLYSDRASSPVD